MSPAARILVVEDDYAIRQTITEVLEDEGYHVVTARNGAEGLQVLSEGARPHLIVLDVMMPVMDGWAFRRAQRADPRHASIPVLVLSAGHAGDKAVEGMAPSAFLPKPFDLGSLVEAVGRFTGPVVDA